VIVLCPELRSLTNADCSVAAEDRGYFYDSAWNLNRRTNNGTTQVFQVDNKNQLTNATSQVMTFDDNGNMVTASNGCNVLVYDDENRLTQWFFYQNGSSQPGAGDKRTDFVYDGQSRLRKRIEFTWSQQQGTNPPPDDQLSWQRETLELENPGEATNWTAQLEVRYIYDGNRVIQERNGYNVPAVSYTRGTDLSGSLEGAGGIGGLLARSAGYSAGAWTDHVYYHADGNGNISRLINASQGSAAYYRYDPFGNMIGQSGTHAAANVYRFSSKEIHTNSGLYYYLYRFYSPNLQRWINRDPVGEEGGLNLYEFVQNNPCDRVDPLGLIRFGDENWPPTPGGPTFFWIDTYFSLGPPGTKCVFHCIVYGLGPSKDPNPALLKFCVGVAKAALRKAAASNDMNAWDEACQRLHDCHARHE